MPAAVPDPLLHPAPPPAPPALQTLLFSATLPSWVKEITKRFLKPGFKTVDLVGSEKMKVCSQQPAAGAGRGGVRWGAVGWGGMDQSSWIGGRRLVMPLDCALAGKRHLTLDQHTFPFPPSCLQASTSVRHLLLPCHWSQRSLLVPDLVKCYGGRW